MNFQIKNTLDNQQKYHAIIIGIHTQQQPSSQLSAVDNLPEELLNSLDNNDIFTGKKNQILVLPFIKNLNADYMILMGLGENKANTLTQTKQDFDNLAKKLHQHKIDTLCIDMDSLSQVHTPAIVARHLIESIGDKHYQYNPLPEKQKKSSTPKPLSGTLLIKNNASHDAVSRALKTGIAINNGKNLAKTLANLPGNICTPSYLADQAKNLAKSHKLKVTVLNEKEMAKLEMNTLLSVSKGSREPAKLIVMEYYGAGDKKQQPHVLVGKGLTFDAGGISIKPSAKMDEMKYDMCGGANVFGTMLSASELQLDINLIGIVPSSENLPDGDANKPGDVIKSMAGISVEILNTDAEGRLILCDALTYAQRFNPQSVIDIATLTGACLVALGHQTSGVMGNNQTLINNLLSAGEESLDFAWQLPINDSYKAQLKSDYADLANIGGSTAGTITAACFLSYFTEEVNWAHLDIAGTAWGGTYGKRATGRAVPILTQYLIDQSTAHGKTS